MACPSTTYCGEETGKEWRRRLGRLWAGEAVASLPAWERPLTHDPGVPRLFCPQPHTSCLSLQGRWRR